MIIVDDMRGNVAARVQEETSPEFSDFHVRKNGRVHSFSLPKKRELPPPSENQVSSPQSATSEQDEEIIIKDVQFRSKPRYLRDTRASQNARPKRPMRPASASTVKPSRTNTARARTETKSDKFACTTRESAHSTIPLRFVPDKQASQPASNRRLSKNNGSRDFLVSGDSLPFAGTTAKPREQGKQPARVASVRPQTAPPRMRQDTFERLEESRDEKRPADMFTTPIGKVTIDASLPKRAAGSAASSQQRTTTLPRTRPIRSHWK